MIRSIGATCHFVAQEEGKNVKYISALNQVKLRKSAARVRPVSGSDARRNASGAVWWPATHKTVMQGQKRVAAEGDNDRLFLNSENR